MATLALALMPPLRRISRWRIASWLGVAVAQGDGRLAQRPAKRPRAGLGDVARLGSSGRFLQVGGQAGPELQGVGIGKAIEGADLRGNDATPDSRYFSPCLCMLGSFHVYALLDEQQFFSSWVLREAIAKATNESVLTANSLEPELAAACRGTDE